MIRVFLTDDHETYLEGLALLLGKQKDIRISGTALNGQQLLERLPITETDILLLDLHLPDFGEEELLMKIRALVPGLKIIYLTLMRGTRYRHRLGRHDIQGYILKNTSLQELTEALQKVYEGGTYFSKDINFEDAGDDVRKTITIEEKKVMEILSRRELEVLKLICREYSNAEIAEKLFLSVSTIETHRKNLIAKLGVTNTVGLVKFALRNKLID
ncbi:MAG TPA: response regulator transcription factor [Puia sp.]|nr:response regulator transcription factor [Puia sp.]